MWFVSVKATDKKEKVFTNAVFFTRDEKKKQKYKTKPKKLFLSIMIQVKLEKQTAADKVFSDGFFPEEYQYVIATDAASLEETRS